MDLFRWRCRGVAYNGRLCKGWFWGSGARHQRCATHGGVVRHQFMFLCQFADALIPRPGRKRAARIWMGKQSGCAHPLVAVSSLNFLKLQMVSHNISVFRSHFLSSLSSLQYGMKELSSHGCLTSQEYRRSSCGPPSVSYPCASGRHTNRKDSKYQICLTRNLSTRYCQSVSLSWVH